jgi:succinoglycan biosynthesis transport protein ExoP
MSGQKKHTVSLERHSALSADSLWRTFRKRWPMILMLTAAVSLAVTFYTLSQTKIYRSSATIAIDPNPPRPLGRDVQTVVDMGTGNYWSNMEYYETQFKIITSRRIAEDVVRTLGLERDQAFLANLPPGKAAPAAEVTVENAAARLRGRTQVEPVKSSRLVIVSIADADPARAQRLVTALVQAYIDQNVEDVIASTNSAGDWLRDQLDKLKDELEKGELALHGYKMEKGILSVAIDDQSNMLREEMTKYNETLSTIRTHLAHITARRDEILKIDPEDPSTLGATELLDDHVLSDLRTEYIQARREREALVGSGKGESHPEVRAADAKMSTTREALMAEVRSVQSALDRDLTAAKAEESALSSLYEASKRRALDLNLAEIDYKKLLRTKNNTEKLYSLVLERTKESELTRMMKFNNIRIIDSALVPHIAEKPHVPLSIALGTITGLVLALGLAVAGELMDRSLKVPDDLERELGVSVLGLLPLVGAEASANSYDRKQRRKRLNGKKPTETSPNMAELVVHYHPSSAIAEAARAIRTNILFMAPDNPYRKLLVTSAGPAEGKTTVACCIAIAMAQAGQRVLLIDCDLRRPRVHRIFRRSNNVGLTSCLLDRTLLDSAILPSDVPNLSLLPCGPLAPNPSELLHSEAFGKVLNELEARFDRVVLDSPPIVPVTDAAVISRRVDGTVLVIRAFQTTRDLAARAVRSLTDVDARIVGGVLNAVDLDRRGYDYYQYYYYKRYSYASDPAEAQTSAPS